MELNYFKDQLFDLINESDDMSILEIETNDLNDIFTIIMTDGSVFEIKCSKKKGVRF